MELTNERELLLKMTDVLQVHACIYLVFFTVAVQFNDTSTLCLERGAHLDCDVHGLR